MDNSFIAKIVLYTVISVILGGGGRMADIENFHFFNEDCMETMKRYPDKYFDFASCDPPYFTGLGKAGFYGKKNSSIGVKRGDYITPDWDENIPDQAWLDEVVRISKHQIIWGINYYDFIHCQGRIIWDKCNGSSNFSDCEIASCTFLEHVRLFRYMWNGMIQGKSLLEPTKMQGNKKLNEKRIHGTQKPINLYKWLAIKFCLKQFKVYSSHMGSRSDAIAFYDFGIAEFVGSEIDPVNFKKGERWFMQHTSQIKLL